jgi:glycosyltransferase involved in cell wall biosynthesis
MKKDIKVTLHILTLNELEGMKKIMPLIDRNWVEQILVVDGGSTDGTVEWAIENGYEVYRQKTPGLRYAYTEAFPLMRGNVVIGFSPDGNSLPESIPALIEKMREGYDMVVASRYLPPAKSADDDTLTAFGNWLFTKTVNILYGQSWTDVMVMLRAYRKEIYFDLELHLDKTYQLPEKLFSTTLGIEPLMSIRCAMAKLKVAEIPFDEPARMTGKRKLQVWRWGASFLFLFFYDRFFWKVPNKFLTQTDGKKVRA